MILWTKILNYQMCILYNHIYNNIQSKYVYNRCVKKTYKPIYYLSNYIKHIYSTYKYIYIHNIYRFMSQLVSSSLLWLGPWLHTPKLWSPTGHIGSRHMENNCYRWLGAVHKQELRTYFYYGFAMFFSRFNGFTMFYYGFIGINGIILG